MALEDSDHTSSYRRTGYAIGSPLEYAERESLANARAPVGKPDQTKDRRRGSYQREALGGVSRPHRNRSARIEIWTGWQSGASRYSPSTNKQHILFSSPTDPRINALHSMGDLTTALANMHTTKRRTIGKSGLP